MNLSKQTELVLAQYHQRMEEEAQLMQSLPLEEGMRRRDEFLLSVGEETAMLLYSLVKAAKPRIILEIGTSYGYSTLWLAEAANTYDGHVISLEMDAAKADYARQKIREAGLADRVEFVVGDALDYLAKTAQTFDFVLVDLWKELYTPSFDLFFPKLQAGAYVISDNMLFPPHSKPEMDVYRKHLADTQAFDTVLLPIGSGIEISKRR
ncbi:O-methyltransferase [Nibrella saemangeumensis]